MYLSWVCLVWWVSCLECVILSCGGNIIYIMQLYIGGLQGGSSSAVEVEMVEFWMRLAFAELRASADRHVFSFLPCIFSYSG